jgi:glycerol-3-phosphate acyltransferase PlsY
VMLLDVAKGALAATVIARLPLGSIPVDAQTLAVLCGIAAVLGHVFPVYLRFRGGKGVATAAGMFAATAPIPIGFAAGVFALSLFLSGRVSIGSILAAWTVPVSIVLLGRFTTVQHPIALTSLAFVLAAFITYTHRRNIRRLVRGEEPAFPKLQLWKRWFNRR